ncbi:hypothetical protein BOTBODRAFT_38816 [Botryobasidium botryosum FD-172 SS1]|uniref:Uncharacterized protein n=1 Tax=Botryobasidium botryosum (strain FD-172 SS1) TaxID=930990 RepID=A0A067M766_BOTB1|nr:hypothetical protein BOTBODRAFT_38816 [Botryobasidium botryosum FD-172 SS1]
MSAIALDAREIASLSLQTTHTEIQLGSTEHRIRLVSEWDIAPGSRVLEVGCGQGDTTAILATAVGPAGHVTALDPASLDYGAPFTLGQAQAHLSSGPLGPRITWVQTDPISFARAAEEAAEPKYDVAVMALSLWYFSSPAQVRETLRALAGRARRVCIAEYALSATDPAAVPHVLAALTQSALEAHKPTSTTNVRTVLSPVRIKALAAEVGLELVKEEIVVPVRGMFDGLWETNEVKKKSFEEEIVQTIADEKQRSVALALRDAMEASLKQIKDKDLKILTMDIWVGSFTAPE